MSERIENDQSALSALAYIALIPLIGLGGVGIVWAYEQLAGAPLFESSSGVDVMNYVWLGVAAVIGIVVLVLVLRGRSGGYR